MRINQENLFEPAFRPNRQELKDAIVQLLLQGRPLKASHIAYRLTKRFGVNILRHDVNSILYKELRGKVKQSLDFYWTNVGTGASVSKGPAPKPVYPRPEPGVTIPQSRVRMPNQAAIPNEPRSVRKEPRQVVMNKQRQRNRMLAPSLVFGGLVLTAFLALHAPKMISVTTFDRERAPISPVKLTRDSIPPVTVGSHFVDSVAQIQRAVKLAEVQNRIDSLALDSAVNCLLLADTLGDGKALVGLRLSRIQRDRVLIELAKNQYQVQTDSNFLVVAGS